MPDGKVLEYQKIMNAIAKSERRMEDKIDDSERRMEKKIDGLYKGLNDRIINKVSFSTFTWVLGTLLVLIVGIQGVIWSKLENMNVQTLELYKSTSETGTSVSNLDIKFEFLNEYIKKLEVVD